MLIRFEVANFRSIRESVELSMVAIDRDRPAAREAPMLGESLLTVAGIYGPNASGKSTVVSALAWLAWAVRTSLREWDDGIPVEPFAFGVADEPTQFVVEALLDGVRFEYQLELNAERVLYEGLFHYPEKKRRRIFEREGLELKTRRGLKGAAGMRELLTERVLMLSVGRRFGDPDVAGFASELLGIETMGIRPIDSVEIGIPVTSRFRRLRTGDAFIDADLFDVAGQDRRPELLALLRLADLGVDDVDVVWDADPETPGRATARLQLRHRLGNHTAPLDLAQESEGTRAWFRLIGPALGVLRDGALLLVDEIDASLHPTLSAELIRIFHGIDSNPRGAQLIFTSHDTSLLGHLNRDEVWLTEKQADGSTRLGALSDFAGERVRTSQNLERGYLQGRFGAVPQIDQAEFLRLVGLIG